MIGIRLSLLIVIYTLCVISLRRDCNYINFDNNVASPYIMKGHPLNVCLGFSYKQYGYNYGGSMQFSCNINETGVNMLLYSDDNCNPDNLTDTKDVTKTMTFPLGNSSYGPWTYNTSTFECGMSNDCEYFEYTLFAATPAGPHQCQPVSDVWFRSAFLSNACVNLEDDFIGTYGSGYYSCNYDDGSLSWNRYYATTTCDGFDINSGDIPMSACFEGSYAGYSIDHCPNNSSKGHKLRNIIIIVSIALVCVCIISCILCNQCRKKTQNPTSEGLLTTHQTH